MVQTKILLIDTTRAFCACHGEAFVKTAHERLLCVFCGGWPEKLSEQSDVDVVVLDVKMPVMDGIDTLREIKKRFPTVEVIMLTGHAEIRIGNSGHETGRL